MISRSFRPEIWAGREGTEAAAGSCSRNPTQRSSPNVKLLCTRGYYRCSQSKERSRMLPATSDVQEPFIETSESILAADVSRGAIRKPSDASWHSWAGSVGKKTGISRSTRCILHRNADAKV